MKLTSVREQAREIALQRRLGEHDGDLEGALESLRELAQGIYPALLADEGLGPALMSIGDDTDSPVQVSAIESASQHDRARARPVCRDGRAPHLIGA